MYPNFQEGVSDKTHPIHVKWDRPVTIQTCNPEISGDTMIIFFSDIDQSTFLGDEGGLESLGISSIDVTQPPVALEVIL